jgi:hypothetical protein
MEFYSLLSAKQIFKEATIEFMIVDLVLKDIGTRFSYLPKLL